MVKYSPTEHSCYDTNLNYSTLPEDLIELTKEEYETFWLTTPPEGKMLKVNTYPFEFEDFEILKDKNLEVLAKTLRDFTISYDLIVEDLDGASFQCLDKAVDIKLVIDEAEMLGALETDSIAFRLSDNTWRDTTLAELRVVYLKYLERKREVWKQFAQWDQGDKTEAFEIVL